MSGLYNLYKEDLLDRDTGVDYMTDDIQCALLSATYTFNADTHLDRDDLTGVVVAAADSDLGVSAAKTNADGVADAGDLTYTAVTGSAVTQLVIYKDTGAASTDILIAHIDGFTSVTPNGGDISITWSDGASRIFAF